MNTIKTPSDLKYAVEQAGTSPHYFTRETMRCFGDTMKNYGLRQPVKVKTRQGEVMAYELFRRRPVKHSLENSSWWNAETLEKVFPE